MSETQLKKVVIIGSSCVDRFSFLTAPLPKDGKITAPNRKGTGGGGANAAIAAAHFFEIDGIDAEIILHTKMGEDSYTRPSGEIIYNEHKARVVRDVEAAGVKIRDLARGKFHYVPENLVISTPVGRPIIKDGTAEELMASFGAAAIPMSAEALQDLQDDIKDADAVLIFGSYGQEAVMAARIASEVRAERQANGMDRERPLEIITDYDVYDPAKAEAAKDTLLKANYITAPTDAVAPGMTYANADILFDTLVNDEQYTACLYAFSDAGNSVRVNHAYKSDYVDPGQVDNVIDSNGAGDVRSAKLTVEVVKKTPIWQAIQYANRAATFSTQFRGREWMAHIANFFRTRVYTDWKPQETVGPHLAYSDSAVA